MQKHPSFPQALRSMGQNFLVNSGVCRAIVDAADFKAEDTILELGPGMGALTFELVKSVRRVVAVELDERMCGYLETRARGENVANLSIVRGNMLHISFGELAREWGVNRIKIIGNLPYNISSPMLFRMVEAKDCIEQAVVMLQKEVADRIVAPPNCKAYGVLSVIFQYASDVEYLISVPPHMFRPMPKVMSSVIRIRFRPVAQQVWDFSLFVRLVKALFQQRRKILSNSLRSFLSSQSFTNKFDALQCLEICEIKPDRRPETLYVEEFVRLANTISGYITSLEKDHDLKNDRL